jgi:hypothetical protein
MKARGKHYENQACDNRRAGYAPGDRLGQHVNGTIYGTTGFGGTNDDGMFFP